MVASIGGTKSGSGAGRAAERSGSGSGWGGGCSKRASTPAATSSLVRPVFTLVGVRLRIPARDRGLVALVDQQPLPALGLRRGIAAPPVWTIVNRPRSRSPRGGTSARRHGRRRPGHRSPPAPGAPVPHDHVAGAVLAGRDHRPRSRGTRSGGPRCASPCAAHRGPGSVRAGTAQLTSTPSTSSRRS